MTLIGLLLSQSYASAQGMTMQEAQKLTQEVATEFNSLENDQKIEALQKQLSVLEDQEAQILENKSLFETSGLSKKKALKLNHRAQKEASKMIQKLEKQSHPNTDRCDDAILMMIFAPYMFPVILLWWGICEIFN